MKETLTASSAFQLLIQASADAIDTRKQGEDAGIIQPWMNQDEGIAIVLALMVRNGYEPQFSPQLMTSLLMNYCRDDVADAFVEFFCQLSEQSGVAISAADLRKRQFDALIDIRQSAITGKSLGWKQAWGPFKEPHASHWREGFSSC